MLTIVSAPVARSISDARPIFVADAMVDTLLARSMTALSRTCIAIKGTEAWGWGKKNEIERGIDQ